MSTDIELKPRSYQLDLVEYVTQRNGIIYLPTGSGKTYVAILALKRFSHELQATIEDGGKRSIFMCNTVELARQQALCVKKMTNLKIGFYVGERDVDNWNRGKWEDEIRENQVLIGTAQVFLNLLIQNYLRVRDLSLVIIDECHHGTGQHPMHEFMRLLEVSGERRLPRVIGLTGVLIKGNVGPKTVEKNLKELEITYRGNIITVTDIEQMQNVMLFSTCPNEKILLYKLPSHNFKVVDVVNAKIEAFFQTIDKIVLGNVPPKLTKNLGGLREPSKKNFVKNTFKDFQYQMTDFGLYTGSMAIVSILIEFEIKKRQAETITLRNMYRSAVDLCENIRHIILRKLRDMLDDDDDDDDDKCHSVDIIENFSSPKLCSLLRFLKLTFGGKNAKEICCLLFVDRRHTAKCIFSVIQKYIDGTPSLQKALVPQFMVGRNSLSSDFADLLERKWNKTAIEQFQEGTCNMIICSNVLEEGIDVQACNYVIVLDPLKTFNSYVQTKGRARSKNSTYIMFVPEVDKDKFALQIKEYKETHASIKKYLERRVLERSDPLTSEINEHFSEIIQPFKTRSGAVLLPSAALMLVHRYCQSLPSDSFGIVLPWFNLLKPEEKKTLNPSHKNGEIVSLTLPLNSKLREVIYSDPMPSAKAAKISAAFKTCIKLYELGELNEKLLPKSVKEQVSNVAKVHFEHWSKFGDDVNAKFKESSTRTFASKCPAELYDALPRVGEVCYAYQMIFTPDFEENEYNSHMYKGLLSKATYALLLRNPLPRLAEMPLFANQGKLNVQISQIPIEILIETEEDLKKLQMYHLMIFRDLLNIWHSYFVLDKRSRDYSYLVVPITANGHLDWNLVSQFQRLSQSRTLNTVERGKLQLRPEDYNGKVITQWYANFENKRFVVTDVRTDLSPQSQMDAEGRSYAEFTISKYGHCITDIVHKNQFLLEVREVTPRVNFFINAKGKSQMLKKHRSKMFLIPELCHNFKYPGDLFLKVIFLPCILHRLKYMLHAEHMRVRINKYLGLDTEPQNSTEYKPQPLIIDASLRRNFDDNGNAVADKEDEEPKSVLEPLPTKEIELSMEKLQITDLSIPWESYMEPFDYARNILTTYPVELSYYYKFTTGQLGNMETLVEENEELWAKSQFDMPKDVKYGNVTSNFDSKLPAINASPNTLDDPWSLSILDRTLDTGKLTPAEQAEFVAALTTASASDVFDMERFEVLGDSFLKFSSSLYLASRYPLWNEGVLTEVKSKMVSNRNLLYLLFDTDIPQRICKSVFHSKYSWLPPMVSLPYNVLELWEKDPQFACQIGVHNLHEIKLSEDDITDTGLCEQEQFDSFVNSCKQNAKSAYSNYNIENEINCFVYREQIADKVVADTLEALLGVCVKNYGIQKCFRMLEFFGILKPDPNKPLTNLLDLKLGSDALRTNISSNEVDCFLTNYKYLERNLGYNFRDRAYLLQALTHPSFPTNRITGCYQELEFIGDAILDFLVSAHIFERQIRMTPGQLTDLRSALVNNTTLACVCVRHRFHLFLLSENSVLSESIKNFAEFQESQNHRVTDQVRILMDEEDSTSIKLHKPPIDTYGTPKRYNLSVNVDVPKALGDIVEALIAAVYLDSRDLKQTWKVIHKLLEPELIAFSQKIPINALRQLNEHKYAKPKFGNPVNENEVIMVTCEFTCLDKTVTVHGFGQNAKQAKLSAAKHALQKLNQHYSK